MKEAAKKGNSYVADRLGKEYLAGEVVPKYATKAVEWFLRSAEAGNAQYIYWASCT